MLLHDPCPVCGSGSHVVVTTKPYRIVECQNCFISYRNPKPAKDELDAYYSTGRTSTHAVDQGMRELQAKQRLAQLASRADIGKAACILDVGCDDGLFLRIVKQKYPEIELCGVEPSRERAQLAKVVCGSQNVQAVSLEEAVLRSGFDLITAFHVLEHVHELSRFMGRLRQIMSKDTLLCMEVPTVSLSRLDLPFGVRILAPGYTQSPEHLCFFKRRSFRFMLEHFGFHIVYMSCVTFGVQPKVNSFIMRHGPQLFPLYQAISKGILFPFNATGNGLQVMAVAKKKG